MAQCSAIWVVSPITRAVDDKAARDLLGSSFRLQLHLDGSHSNVSFICSKTDDISVEEAAETLNDEGRLEQVNKAADALDEELDAKIQIITELRERNTEITKIMDDQGKIKTSWERLAKKAEKQQQVQLPAKLRETLSKRKRQNRPSRPRKKRGAPQPADEAVSSDDDEVPTVMTKEGIDARVATAQAEYEQSSAKLQQSDKEIDEAQASINELQQELTKVKESRLAVYIQLRNLYSRGAIRNDFAAGIRE